MTIVWCIIGLYVIGLASLAAYLFYVYLVLDKRPVVQSEDEVILPHPHQRRD